MRQVVSLLAALLLFLPLEAINIGFVSGKANAKVYLADGNVVTGDTNLPKEKQDKLKLKVAGRDTVIMASDIDHMVVRSTKYATGKEYVMRWTEYYKKPGGKPHKPAWVILWQEGPYCDMWCVARKAAFGLEGDMNVYFNDNDTVELYWKKDAGLPTMIRNLDHCARYFSDDAVIVEKIKTQRKPPFYMTDQVREYIPGRK